ncbi:Acetyl-CoA acetyltransferase [Moraxella caprae]|uniref:Beta-ketoadipyl-CoA thiolase n=1 Tax=Moraxella caprae TaxID=90240 RepID=A0A378R2A9_9GAMM|nr:thiolase family protein [Moraxella caprae]STZ09392.1 Acetyl-CoA acetyltransferase [Moraxella caprae]
MSNPVIISASRTPMGAFQGAFASLSSPQLGAVAIRSVLDKAGVSDDKIDEVIMGCVLSAGVGQAPARQAMRLANMPDSVGATMINKVCGSGLMSVMTACNAIKAGDKSAVIAGGMDSMTNAPYALPKARGGFRMGHGEVRDLMFFDGLQDAESGKLMGVYAQEMADKKGYTRTQMDEFAISSLKKAMNAIDNGYFKDEICPVTVSTRKGDVVVDTDEQPANANIDKIPTLKPAFAKDGTITPANASSISDGASVVLVASAEFGKANNLPVLARIVAHASHAQHPSEFTIAPVGAMQKVLDKAGWTAKDVDVWEINEAFAMVTLSAIDAFELDADKVNIHGGACALGHPLGSSGARILVTLIHALKRVGGKKGVASLCIGGGEAVAMAIELV